MKDRRGVTPQTGEEAEKSPMKQLTNCPLRRIKVNCMALPRPEKIRFYENYFLETRRFAHDIIVDENKNIREGYVTYLLALKYGVRPDVFEVPASQPVQKVVKCRNVRYRERRWEVVDSRIYVWAHDLGYSVAPGDILRVSDDKGPKYVQVEEVAYEAGEEACKKLKKVLSHVIDR